MSQDILDVLAALVYLAVPTSIVGLALYGLARMMRLSVRWRRGLVLGGSLLSFVCLVTVAVLVIKAYIAYPFLD